MKKFSVLQKLGIDEAVIEQGKKLAADWERLKQGRQKAKREASQMDDAIWQRYEQARGGGQYPPTSYREDTYVESEFKG